MMNLGKAVDGVDVSIDLEKLVEGRLMMQANSGAGKSWALRRVIEQTAGRIQHIILDVEDEFHTLREKHDYILAGRDGGDCPADSRSAELLARRLLELGMSAVISIYEMKPDERTHFVRLFLESLVSAPRSLWHPALIIIDEAHMFAPETSKSESMGAVVDLMARGRKRGFAGVLATQRISKINKDAIAEVNNKLIGRSALDLDMKRSADELGFFGREAQLRLRTLPAGMFFAFGPALSQTVVEMQVGPVFTTHPKAGQRSAPATPAPEKVKAVLAQLANLPKEAEEEAHTVEQLRTKVRQLETEARKVQRPAADPAELMAAEARGYERAERHYLVIHSELVRVRKECQSIRDICDGIVIPDLPQLSPPPELPHQVHEPRPSVHKAAPVVHKSGPGRSMQKAPRAVLSALAQYPDGRTKVQVALLTGYAHSGGGFNNALSWLRTQGYLQGSDTLRITESGFKALGPYDPLPSGSKLLEHWLRQLSKAERAALQALADAHPYSLSKEELANRSGYEASGGGFNNALSRLRTLELIEGRGEMKASDTLFE